MRRAIHSLDLSRPLTTHLPKIIIAIFLCLTAFLAANTFAAVQSGTCNQGKAFDKGSMVQKAFGLQVPFIANEGQIDRRVRFYAQTFGGKFYLTEGGELVYTFAIPDTREKIGRHPKALRPTRILSLREQLIGASQVSLQGIDRAPAKINYFTGSDRSNWKTNIPTYNTVSLGNVYEGIGLSLKAYGDNVEKIFTVQPGADFSQIKLQIEGAADLKINNQGELEINSPQGAIRFSKPLAYQEKNGQRQPVQVAYLVQDNAYGFKVTGHDPDLPLVIDPCLSYATYLGGAGEDGAFAVAADAGGNAYVAGFTLSADFPFLAGDQQDIAGNYDGFVTKFDRYGEMIYSTYLGGELDDLIYAIAVDAEGSAYVTGETGSKRFPVRSYYDRKIGGNSDLFVTKFDQYGEMIYSTYLGGGGPETGYAIAVDADGFAYVAGATQSSNFPVTPEAYSTTAGNVDAFVTKLNQAGNDREYSTILGGSGADFIRGIAIDQSGNAYVTGQTASTNFSITTGALDTDLGGPLDAFVAKLNPAASDLVYSTYLGGSDEDIGNAIAVDSSGNAYVAGQTLSGNFPISNAYQNSINGGWDAFVTKLDANGTLLYYSTYLGGILDDEAYGIAINEEGDPLGAFAYVTGETLSENFPVFDDLQAYGGLRGGIDAFLSKLNSAGSDLLYSTLLGGSADDVSYGIAVDNNENAYIAGYTYSDNFPVTSPTYQNTNMGDLDAFLSVINLADFDEDGIPDACDNCPNDFNPKVEYQEGASLDDCATEILNQAVGDLWQPDFDCDGQGDECDDDDDNDGLTDEWELQFGGGGLLLNPQDPDTDDDDIPDGEEDFDEGGLLNLGEQEVGSNPHLKDSDGDAWSDLMEVQAGSSPTNREDYPDPSIFNNGIFVNKDTGTDLNLGTETYPLKSIHAAFDRLNLLAKGLYTIRIAAGIYSIGDSEPDAPIDTGQNVIINAAGVTMDGAGAISWTQGFVFSPLASDVTINGLNIFNFNEAVVFNTDGGCATLEDVNISACQTGLQLVEAYQLKIDLNNSQISDCQTGIEFAAESSDNSLNNGKISGNFAEAVKVSGGTGNQLVSPSISGPGAYGLKIEMGVTDFTVSGGTIEDVDVGMGFATDGASITVSGATIQDCRAGIEFLENYMINVDLVTAPDDTLITNCETGILFTAGSANNTVLNGIVQGNDDGIRFERCADDPDGEAPADNRITGTEIKDNSANGIAILAGAANELIEVKVSGSATGVYMGSASSYNVLRGGTVSGTKENFNLDGSNNTIKGPMTLQSFGQIAGNGNELVDIILDGSLSTEPYGLQLDQGSEKIILKNVTIKNYDVGIGFTTNAACLNLTGVLIQDCRIGVDIRENYMLDIDLGDTEIRNCNTGIEIAAGSSNNTIRNGSVVESLKDGILFDGCKEAPGQNKIIGTTVQDSELNGIALLAGFDNEVIGATVTGNNAAQIAGGYGGIALLNGSGAVRTSRIFNNGCTGVYLDDSAVADITGNLIYGQPEGIHVALVSDVTIASNTITANADAGMVIEDGALPMIKYNILYGNGTGTDSYVDVSLQGDFEPTNLVENDIGTVNQIDLPPTNISVDPLFCENSPSECDEPFEDYSLQRTSLLIDGTTATEPGIDVRGSSRPKGDSWDMGAIETSSFRDADSDGLPDPWEDTHFGSTNCDTCGAGDDFDGDGVSNLQEYQEGADPNNPVYVRINSPATSPYFTDTPTITISGMSVNASNITVTNGTTIGVESWIADDVSLADGGNVILVTGTGTVDSKPYTATDTITVVKDSADPTVNVLSPTNEGTYTTTSQFVTLSGLANDDTQVDFVSWEVVETGQTGTAEGSNSWLGRTRYPARAVGRSA